MVAAIRGHMASGRVVKSWLFSGPRGTGKTTTARILALSYECKHQEKFGKPCDDCQRTRSKYPIIEVNGSKITGKEALEQILEGAEYGLLGDGSYRVYILDELQKASDHAQSLLLKYFEDSPDTTVFIICSTAPQKILEALRSRCVAYELRELELDDVQLLVKKLLKFAKSDLPVDRLTDALVERRIKAPRLIAQAVEKYIATEDPEQAVEVEGSTVVDTTTLCKAALKGDWETVRRVLLDAQTVDVKSARIGVIAYLKTILLESGDIADRTRVVAKAILTLSDMHNAEDLVVSATLAAQLYEITAVFSQYAF
jgi:DNA polymerase-3 subunit gamma/tau